ncbi:alpha/beta fold hydrolase [Sphingomonas sp.]|uniref:alpha/beta fold hydrolase n=1 Tax=Sphingomonas sp. TaxID=28214 RepID=UPI002DD62E32|nr:alpha/beta fold hydrolase [Sphingomonas sp.]
MMIRLLCLIAAIALSMPLHAEMLESKRITVLVEGNGPDVVLIPGLSSPREVWDATRRQLAGRYRLHIVQVRGFAGDDPGDNAAGPVLEPLTREIADYIDDAIIDRDRPGHIGPRNPAPAVIGHSMGGLIGMKIAAQEPQLVGRLMVVDALPFFGTLLMPDATADKVAPRAAQMRDLLLARADAAKAVADPAVTADPGGNLSITPEGRMQVARWAAKADLRVVAQAMYEDMILDLRGDLGRIAARPFTVLYAAAAPEAKPMWERDYAGSRATLVGIADSRHFIMLDQPARFASEVDAFLGR